MEGNWPDDECGAQSMPIALDAPQPWLDAKTFHEVFADWMPVVKDVGPIAGVWLEGTPVQVSVELAAPASACIDGSAGLWFRSTSRLVTSDGRVNAELPIGWVSADGLSLGSDPSISWLCTQIDTAHFADRTGIAGVDAAGSSWLAASFAAEYSRSKTSVTASGSLEVDGEPMCVKKDSACAVDPTVNGAGVDCLRWPPTQSFPEICGRDMR
jgi:hypothetical protein